MAKGDDLDTLSAIWAAIIQLRRNINSQMYVEFLDRADAGQRDPYYEDQTLLTSWFHTRGSGDIDGSMVVEPTGLLHEDESDAPDDIMFTMVLEEAEYHKDFLFYLFAERNNVDKDLTVYMDLIPNKFREDILPIEFIFPKLLVEEQVQDIYAEINKQAFLNSIFNTTVIIEKILVDYAGFDMDVHYISADYEILLQDIYFIYAKGPYSVNGFRARVDIDPIYVPQDLFNIDFSYHIALFDSLVQDIYFIYAKAPYHYNLYLFVEQGGDHEHILLFDIDSVLNKVEPIYNILDPISTIIARQSLVYNRLHLVSRLDRIDHERELFYMDSQLDRIDMIYSLLDPIRTLIAQQPYAYRNFHLVSRLDRIDVLEELFDMNTEMYAKFISGLPLLNPISTIIARQSYSYNNFHLLSMLERINVLEDLFDIDSSLYRIPYTDIDLLSPISVIIALESKYINIHILSQLLRIDVDESIFDILTGMGYYTMDQHLLDPISVVIMRQDYYTTLHLLSILERIYVDLDLLVDVTLDSALLPTTELNTLLHVAYNADPDELIYGVAFNDWSQYLTTNQSLYANTLGNRTYDAVGYEFTRSTPSIKGKDTFRDKDIGAFRIRRCLAKYDEDFKQQIIVAFDTDEDWNTKINSPEYADYNRMIEFPFFYYRRPTTYEFEISQIQYDGFIPSPMHFRDNEFYECIYITQYLLDASYTSRKDTVAFVADSDTLKDGAKLKGLNIADYPMYMSLMMLMLIKYANLDIASVIGMPNTYISTMVSGLTDNIKGLDGSTSESVSDRGRTVTLGLEDLLSNVNKVIDGIFNIDQAIYLKESASSSRYTKVVSQLPSDILRGKMVDLMYDVQFPYMLLPSRSESLRSNDPSFNHYFSRYSTTNQGYMLFGCNSIGDAEQTHPIGTYFANNKEGAAFGWIPSPATREAKGIASRGFENFMIARTKVYEVDDMNIYGIDFSDYARDQLLENTTGTRTNTAETFVFERSTTEVEGRDDFKTNRAGPFMVRECIMEYNSTTRKQELILSENDEGYEDLKKDPRYNVMIEFPAFYYKRLSPYKIQVSCYQHDDFLPSPMHYRNGVMYEKVYISKFMIDNLGMSRYNQLPQQSTLATHRANVRSKSLYLMDYAAYSAVTMLLLVKYGKLDVQSVIGLGDVYYTPFGNGETDVILSLDGSMKSDLDMAGSTKCLNLENWYGKLWQTLDGTMLANSCLLYTAKDIKSVSSNPTLNNISSYDIIPSKLPIRYDDDTQYIRGLSYNDLYPYSLQPSLVSSTRTPSLGDTYSYYTDESTRFNTVSFGGMKDDIADTGLFSLDFTNTLDDPCYVRSMCFSDETVSVKYPHPTYINCELIVPDPRIYGVKFENYEASLNDEEPRENHTKGIRTYDASYFNFIRATRTSSGSDDFMTYNAGPFMIRECLTKYNPTTHLQDIICYKDDIEYEIYKDNDEYNKMIEFPVFYYYRPSKYEFIVSSAKHDDFLPSPMHWRNNKLYSRAYISKYPLNRLGNSRNNGYSNTMANLRTLCHNRGMYLMDYAALNTLLLLMLVKYANLDMISVIGKGVASTNEYGINNNIVEQILGWDGSEKDDISLPNNSILTMGIANLWGDENLFIDGITRYYDKLFINENIDKIETSLDIDRKGAARVLTDLYTRDDGYAGMIKDLSYDPDFTYALFATDVSSDLNINSRLADIDLVDLFNYTVMAYGGAKVQTIDGELPTTNRFSDIPGPFFTKYMKSTSKACCLGMFFSTAYSSDRTQRPYDYEFSCKLFIPSSDAESIDDTNIYGVDFLNYYTAVENGEANPNTTGRRIQDSSEFIFTRSTPTIKGTDFFTSYEAGPFRIRECITQYDASTGKQTVLMYEDDDNFSEVKDDPRYNRMIEFPAFFYRRVTPYRFEVKAVQEENDGFLPSPMHFRNGIMHEKAYISKYAIDQYFMSHSNSEPLRNNTIEQFRNGVRSQGMYLIDWPIVCSVAMLMMIKYNTVDPTKVIGVGIVNRSSCVVSGQTESVRSKDGSTEESVNNSGSIVTLGLENWWGNVYYVLDGLLVDADCNGRINEDIEDLDENADENFAGYNTISTPFLNITVKNVRTFAYDLSYIYSLHPIEVGDTGSNNYYAYNNGNPSVPWFGGYWGAANANFLSLFCQRTLTVSNNQLGAAAFFLGDSIIENVVAQSNAVINCSMVVKTNVTHIRDNKIYGVEFPYYAEALENNTTGSTSGIRTDNGRDYSFRISTSSSEGLDDFEIYGAGPFMIRECITQYNESTHTQELILSKEDKGYDELKQDPSYNVMIEFPAFFYRRVSPYKIQVSCYQHAGFLPSPMHFRDGVMYEKAYISKYPLDLDYMSRSGSTPKVNTTLETFRTNLRSQGLAVIDWSAAMSLAMLMFVKYANLDVQSVIGNGKTSGTIPLDNGMSDNIKGNDGHSSEAIITLGLENFWGNISYILDGVIRKGDTFYINSDIMNITSNPDSDLTGYKPISTKCPTSPGMIRQLALDEIYPYSMHPTEVGNTPTIGDRFYSNVNKTNQMILLGGDLSESAYYCGILNINANKSINDSLALAGTLGFMLSDEIIPDVRDNVLVDFACEIYVLDKDFDENADRKVYGVTFEHTDLDGVTTYNRVGTRTDDSTSYEFEKSTESRDGVDDFELNEAGPYMIQECLTEYDYELGIQRVVAYKGDSDWSSLKDNPIYNHMIEFPKFYYQRISRYTFKVSQVQYDMYHPSPMHYRNGIMYEKVYISKYALDSSFMSRPNQVPYIKHTIEEYRDGVKAKGMSLVDWPTICSLAILMMIKYAHIDPQEVIGYGIPIDKDVANTGSTLSIRSHDGSLSTNNSDHVSVVSLGLENWWGNVWYYLDGIYKRGDYLYINEDIEAVTQNPAFNSLSYDKIDTKIVNDNKTDVEFAFDDTFPYSLHPTKNTTGFSLIDESKYLESGIYDETRTAEWRYRKYPLHLFMSQYDELDKHIQKNGGASFFTGSDMVMNFRLTHAKDLESTMIVRSSLKLVRDESVYGIDFNASITGTRTDDATSFKFSRSTITEDGVDDFRDNQAGPFMIRECLTQYNSSTRRQEVIRYDDDTDFKELCTNSSYNRMVEFPAFYYRRLNRYKFQLTTTPKSGFNPSPMHYRNGVMYEKIYISKYNLDSLYKSAYNKTPLTEKTIAQYRTQVRSQGMYLIDWPIVSSIAILMFVKYGSLDVQDAIGIGCIQEGVENSEYTIEINGATDEVKSLDGSTKESVDEAGSIVTLGLENWWGNVWTYVDGIYRKGEYLYINENIQAITADPVVTNANNGYTKIATATTTSRNNMKVPAFDGQFPYSLHPTLTEDDTRQSMSEQNWEDIGVINTLRQSGWMYNAYSAAILLANAYTSRTDNTGARSFFFSEETIDEDLSITQSYDIECSIIIVDPDLIQAGSDLKKYGVTFDRYASRQSLANTAGSRIEWAHSYTFRRSTLLNTGQDDFIENNAGPYRIRECLTEYDSTNKSHAIIAYKGDSDYDTLKTNASYNHMVEFPMFYYKRSSPYEFIVSTSNYVGFNPSPMHTRNGIIYDYAYISKYALDSSYMSRPSKVIKVSTTLSTFRSGIRSKGMYLIDWPVVCSLAMLMFIKYGNLDVQSVIGLGHAASRNSRKVITGTTSEVLSPDGSIATKTNTNGSVVTLGLENYYGNVWYYVDGLFKKGEYLYINENIETVTSNPSSRTLNNSYTKINTPLPTTEGGIKTLAYDQDFLYSLHPTTVEENDNMGDYYWYGPDNSLIYQAVIGGSYYDDVYCGPLYLNTYTELGLSDESLGALAFFLVRN